ncbi:MAG: NAD(+)/NADH kinase [Thermoprotei archaeon]
MEKYARWSRSVEVLYLSHRPGSKAAQEAENKVASQAESMGIDVVRLSEIERVDGAGRKPSIIISLGGDGTLLRARAKVGSVSVPFLSVNYGGLGALSELEPEELDEWLPKVLKGDFMIEERALLESENRTALNEVLVKSSEIGKSALITLRVGGHYLFKARGDGIIVATPTGSSAYAFSAGGPLVDPSLIAMVVVPVAPFFWGIRPFVIGDSEVSVIAHDNIALVIDGERIACGTREVSVRLSRERAKFIRVKPFSFSGLYRKLESRLV